MEAQALKEKANVSQCFETDGSMTLEHLWQNQLALQVDSEPPTKTVKLRTGTEHPKNDHGALDRICTAYTGCNEMYWELCFKGSPLVRLSKNKVWELKL